MSELSAPHPTPATPVPAPSLPSRGVPSQGTMEAVVAAVIFGVGARS